MADNASESSFGEPPAATARRGGPAAIRTTVTAKPLLENVQARPPKDAIKGSRRKPSSFSLGSPGSPMKPPSGLSLTQREMALEQLLSSLATSAEEEASADLNAVMPGIVKLFSTHTYPNYSLPWQMKRSMQSTSTGFIISKERILTNAHCVENWTQVKLRRRGSPTKYIARVIAIGRDCDIALLTVDDPQFWKDSKSFVDISQRRTLPKLEERVSVVGYPVGGENLSVTSGVVSRIDMQEYANGIHDLLAIQVDAPINPGNSGGPVFDSSYRFVGIAFQSLSQAEGVGYIIPLPVVHHFLEDLARHDGKYTGFPSLALDTQGLENPSLRRYLGVPEGVTGVLVIKVEEMSPCKGKVKEGDVLTEIDGHKVGDDQTVEFPSGLVVGDEDEEMLTDDDEEDGGEAEEMEVEGAEGAEVMEEAAPAEAEADGDAKDDSSQWEDVDSPGATGFNSKQLRDTLARKRGPSSTAASEESPALPPTRRIRFEGGAEAEDAIEEVAEEAGGDEEPTPELGYAERIDADYLVTQKQTDDSITLTLFNKATGTRKERIQLAPPNMLVPPEGTREKKGREDLKLPSYRVVGGVVLTMMTEAYLGSEFGSAGMSDSAESTPIDLLALWSTTPKKFADEEVVLCAQILAHDSNVGYEGMANLRLSKINGQEVRNLKQASKTIDEAIKTAVANKASGSDEGQFLRFDFGKGPVMVLDAAKMGQITQDVLEQHLVPKDRSDDLVDE